MIDDYSDCSCGSYMDNQGQYHENFNPNCHEHGKEYDNDEKQDRAEAEEI